jgi:hypothetical protein
MKACREGEWDDDRGLRYRTTKDNQLEVSVNGSDWTYSTNLCVAVKRIRALAEEPPATWVRKERLEDAIKVREILADQLEAALDIMRAAAWLLTAYSGDPQARDWKSDPLWLALKAAGRAS